MKSTRTLLLALALASVPHAHAEPPADPHALAELGSRIDTELFDAYNRCDLERFGALVAEDIEFFHDQAGVMHSRASVVGAVRQHICGKVRRELVEGTLQTFPMQGYGVVQLGSHRFCESKTGNCVGIARFVNLWRQNGERWELARVISYDHRPLSAADAR
ncbi:MAG TPA: nuclear transport factor 2 family protein [Lysobacter sp.]|nr:nuclear transport factor 2 family protein [Lysobacter sp.]